MKLEISAAVVGLFAAVISGAAIADPAPKANGITHALDSPSKFAKRGIVYLKVCTDANFEGRCQNLESQTGQCCMFWVISHSWEHYFHSFVHSVFLEIQ